MRVLLRRHECIKDCEEAHATLLANRRNPRGGLCCPLAKGACRAFNRSGEAVAELGAGDLVELGALLFGRLWKTSVRRAFISAFSRLSGPF